MNDIHKVLSIRLELWKAMVRIVHDLF
jgi:hypothetical protein